MDAAGEVQGAWIDMEVVSEGTYDPAKFVFTSVDTQWTIKIKIYSSCRNYKIRTNFWTENAIARYFDDRSFCCKYSF